jgi:hypothetical protein
MTREEKTSEEPSAIDEFANIPSPKTRRPLSAGVVLILGGLILFAIRDDIRYALSSRAPEEVGDARSLSGKTLDDNRFVAVTGQPDRRNALYIDARGEHDRQTFFRLLGAGGRVLVRAADTNPDRVSELADRWTGRLRRVDKLPYAGALRSYYLHNVIARRFMKPDTLREALGGQNSLRDRAGEPLTLAPDAVISIDVSRGDKLRVLLAKDKFAAAEDARKEVERMGFAVEPDYGTADAFGAVVKAPSAERNSIIARLDEKGLPWQAADLRMQANRANMKASADGLTLNDATVFGNDGTAHKAGTITLPWADVVAGSVEEPVRLPADAFVLTEGESPRSLWWAPAVAALLLAFMAFNVWYLARGRRA